MDYYVLCKRTGITLGVTWPEIVQQGYYIKFWVRETLFYNISNFDSSP